MLPAAEAGPSPASAAPGTQQLVVPRRRATLLRDAAAKAAQNASAGRVAELELRVRELEQSNGRLHRSAGQLSQTLQEREEQLESALAQVEEAERLCAQVEGLRGAVAFELERAGRSGNGEPQSGESRRDGPGGGGGGGGGRGVGGGLLLRGPVTSEPPAIPEALMGAVSPGDRLLLPGPGSSGSAAVRRGGPDQVAELRASSSLLRHVPTAGVRHLLDRAVQLVLAEGDVALAEGQTPPGMLIVLEGSLEVFHFEGDERVTLQIVSAGDILCEMALLTPEPVMSSTVVLRAARALKIARTDMEEVLRRHPECVPAVRREAALQIRDALKGGERYRRGTVVTRGSPVSSLGGAPPPRPAPPSPDPKPDPGRPLRDNAEASLSPLDSSGSHFVPVVEAAGTVAASRSSKYNVAALLRSIPILKSLPEEALRSLVGAVHIKSCISGELVVAEGDVADEAFLVLEGTLQITSSSFRVALGLANHGDVIGEASMLEDGFRTATVTALTDARLLCIHRDHLGGIFRELPDLRQIMVGLMLRREQENSQKLPRSTFARRKASMMTPTAPVIIEVPLGVGSIPGAAEEEESGGVEELGRIDRLSQADGREGKLALQVRAAASGRTLPRPSPSPSGRDAGAAGRSIGASIRVVREVAQGISELGAARGRLQAQVERLKNEANGNVRSRDRSATEAKSLTQALRSALQERDAMQARLRVLETEAEETSARAAAAVEEAAALKARAGQTPGARPGARAASPEKEKGEASAPPGGGSEKTLEELQASYEAAAKREREILLRQRELRSPQRSQFCPTPASRRHVAAATPGFPQETPSTLGLPDETTRSEDLLSALGSVKRQVSGLTRSALVLQAREGVSAAAMPLAPGHPVIVTPGKARGPAWGRAGGKPDLSARLAVIDSLLDNFEVAS